MKVLHLSSSDNLGGAAIAALRIHSSLNSKLESKMFVSRKNGSFPGVFSYESEFMRFYSYMKNGIGSKLTKLQITDNKSLHSFSCLPSKLDRYINNSPFDLIHLHWIQGEMISIEAIGRIKKPIVWTLHDNWAFSGSEHLPKNMFDSRYREGYTKFNKPNGEKYFDFNKWCWERKRNHWKNPIQIICPSRWLAKCAKDSLLMKKWDIDIIPHPIDIKLFKPWPKEIAKDLFKLPKNKRIILFGAMDGTKDPNKGWDLMQKSLNIVHEKIPNCLAVIFGQSSIKRTDDIKIPIKFVGKLKDPESLSMLYSAADITVVPSRIESFSQTASESTSCGTPVVGFNYSGLKDVVTNNFTGYLVDPYDYKKLSEAIIKLLKDNKLRKSFQSESRKKALKTWSYERISKMYYQIYKKVIYSR